MQRSIMFALLLAALISSGVASSKDQDVALTLKKDTNLRVGESALLQVPSEHEYLIEKAGDVLRSVRRSKTTVIYRAVKPGHETIILSPTHLQTGECVSCGTLHYFIMVVPRK
jgi:hypothetical protein